MKVLLAKLKYIYKGGFGYAANNFSLLDALQHLFCRC